MKTKIYVLLDENGNIRYVGKTSKRLCTRFSNHLSEAPSGIEKSHKNRLGKFHTEESKLKNSLTHKLYWENKRKIDKEGIKEKV